MTGRASAEASWVPASGPEPPPDRGEQGSGWPSVELGSEPSSGPSAGSSPRVPLPETQDGVGARLREARVRARLLGEPLRAVRIDRFTVLDHLGSGGMGEVYAAYDDKLERKVAIKLVRAHASDDPRSNQRLESEAKALAQLSHPNVVQVYDVGVFDGRIFLAMELVRGETLAAWLSAARRLPARRRHLQVLHHFLAAGRGLQAAHRAGLAHRDFKPSNVLVGDDGRVRVVDFGLAGVASDQEPRVASLGSPGEAAAPTPALAVAGTPRYMAPEQLRGQLGDSRSDQFSFCVALYEAVEGRLPAAVTERETGGPPPASAAAQGAMPPSVRRALRRGLAADPELRFPDMQTLLATLEAWPRRRGRAVGLVIATALLAIVAVLLHRGDRPAALVCQDVAVELAEVWNPGRRVALTQALERVGAQGLWSAAYAREALPRITGKLDRYAADWTAMRGEACSAYHSGRESTNFYDRRVVCLSRRRADLQSTIAVLTETRPAQIGRVVEVSESLPSLSGCANREALLAASPPPEDPAQRRRAELLEARLGRARAVEQAGRDEDAVAEIAEVAKAAEELGYRPLLARALLAQGRIGIATSYDSCPACLRPLHLALELGLELGLDAEVVEAFARLVFAESATKDPTAYVPLAEAISKRVADRRFVVALLANNVGVVYMKRGEPARARQHFERSVALGDGPDLDIELLRARTNLAMVTADPQHQDQRFAEALQRITERLGPHHTLTLRQRVVAALYTRSPARAAAALAATCQDYAAYHPRSPDVASYCRYHLAFLEAELGNAAAAADHLTAAAAAFDALDPRREIALGFAQLHQRSYAGAAATFRRVLKQVGAPAAEAPWWALATPALARLGLGQSEQAAGRPREAIAALEPALALLDQLRETSVAVEYQAQRATAALTLARALAAAGRDGSAPGRAQVRELRAAAEAWYRDAGQGYQWRLDELAAEREAR